MPWGAKLRILADLWKNLWKGNLRWPSGCAHRFGKDLLPFADAVYTGTYAGDIDRLKIDAVMPGVRDLERKYGSVLRGVLRTRRETRRRRDSRKGLPAMTSFQRRHGHVAQRLAASLGEQSGLAFGRQVHGVVREELGWRVQAAGGDIVCRHLVLALPVNQGLALVAEALPAMPPPLAAIPEARILSVLLGFDDRARIPFGFGYLAPEREERFTLGALFSSHMFPGRAPEGHQLSRPLWAGAGIPSGWNSMTISSSPRSAVISVN
jgi:protoporphyrinogen/coproporphyrinogen III oxidase